MIKEDAGMTPRWAMGWAAEMTDGQGDGQGTRKCRRVNAAEQMSWKCMRGGKRGSTQKTQTVGSRSLKSLVEISSIIIVKSCMFGMSQCLVLSAWMTRVCRNWWSCSSVLFENNPKSVLDFSGSKTFDGVEHGQCHECDRWPVNRAESYGFIINFTS